MIMLTCTCDAAAAHRNTWPGASFSTQLTSRFTEDEFFKTASESFTTVHTVRPISLSLRQRSIVDPSPFGRCVTCIRSVHRTTPSD